MPKRKEVDAWFARYDNPMKDVVLRIREIILKADPRIDECIKWQAPTFMYEGNLASFFPKSKQHASLMFHRGAEIPGRHPRLEGTGDSGAIRRYAFSTSSLRISRVFTVAHTSGPGGGGTRSEHAELTETQTIAADALRRKP